MRTNRRGPRWRSTGRVWELIGGSGAAVNLCPRSDAAFGVGSAVAPVARALRHAGAVGLSNDNEISYRIAMFAEMQTLQARHRGEAFRRRAAGEDVPADELSPARLLGFATAAAPPTRASPTESARSRPAAWPTSC